MERCLIGLQKGVSKTSKGRLLEAKRACVGIEVCENSLQIAVVKRGIRLWTETLATIIGIYLD